MSRRLQPFSIRQQGAASLLMALVILVLITGMTLVSTEIYTLEQRVAGNELRQRQSLDAAMTGFERAMAYVEQNTTPDVDGNGVADSIAAPSTDPSNRVSVASGGNYAVEICDPDVVSHPLPSTPTASCTAATYAANNFKRLLIYARGWSDDNTGVRHVVAVLERTPGVANAPSNPLTTHGTAAINGSGDVTNPEGQSTIWSGQTVTLTNANFKTNILSPSGSGQIVETSNRDSFGPDVVQNDGNLATLTGSEYFANFFGTDPTSYKNNYATSVFPAANIGTYDGAERQILWSEGNTSLSGNPTFGTAADPVILIIDGNMSTSGNVTVNGLLYVIGDMSGTGNTTVNGAVVVQGNVSMTGSLDVVFNSTLLGELGTSGRAAISPGSWKDWRDW